MTDDRSPDLIWTDDGAPRSARFGDVYFSAQDGLAESRAVFLAGCGLPEAWRDRSRFTVAELGFGSGLNIAALLDLWRRTKPGDGRLHIFSVEGFPMSQAEAARALDAWPELGEAADVLLGAWPDPTPGFHRLDLPGFDAVLDLAIGDVAACLDRWSGPADAWFLDGFSPATNPDMWSDAVFDRITALSAPGARLATFTVAGAVRRGLSARGFQVDKRPGHGRKRERLEARLTGPPPSSTAPRVAILGAGIAGASLARAFGDLGVRPVVVDAGTDVAASGFPAALVTPRLDAGDAGIAALFAQALFRADDLYGAVEGAVVDRGVLQLEQTPRDATRFGRIARQPIWPEAAMATWSAEACSRHIGEPVAVGGLWMRDALAIRPAPALAAWLSASSRVTAGVSRIGREEAWVLYDDADRRVAEAEIVVVAGGWGTARLLAGLPLAPVLGQADWVSLKDRAPAVAWGGYAIPTGDGLLFGATHDRGQTDPATSDDASARNLAALARRLPVLAERLTGSVDRRAAVRGTTPDRLPVAGPLPDAPGLYVLGGLGSRGFCAAPLLAEHVAALAMGAASPLPLDLAQRVSPARLSPLAQPTNPADH